MAAGRQPPPAQTRWAATAAVGFLVLTATAAITVYAHAWIVACLFAGLTVIAGVAAARSDAPARRVVGLTCAVLAALLAAAVLLGRAA